MRVVGVDGCRGGWITVEMDTDERTLAAAFHGSFRCLLHSLPEDVVIGVDIPIGLIDGERRGCDVAARDVLGWPRRNSVFPAPDRALLAVDDYLAANAASKERFRRGVSRQAFGIFPKVREVDELMTPELQQRVREVHPEVAFWAMNGERPMVHSKRTLAGFAERCDLLVRAFEGYRFSEQRPFPRDRSEARQIACLAAPDDLLDAIAVAWTAQRIASGYGVSIPAAPQYDACGLRMEIVY